MEKHPVELTVNTSDLTVEFWRERFAEAFSRFKGLTELATLMASEDEYFSGPLGFQRLQNVKRNKGGLELTAKVVGLMNKLRPAPAPKVDLSSVLKRQRLVAPSAD